MIRPEIQWIADDAADLANFKPRGCEFYHVRTKLLLDAYGNLFKLSRIPFMGVSHKLALTHEEMEILKAARLRLYDANIQREHRVALEKSTATLKKFYGMDKKDYRLVQDKTKDV